MCVGRGEGIEVLKDHLRSSVQLLSWVLEVYAMPSFGKSIAHRSEKLRSASQVTCEIPSLRLMSASIYLHNLSR